MRCDDILREITVCLVGDSFGLTDGWSFFFGTLMSFNGNIVLVMVGLG